MSNNVLLLQLRSLAIRSMRPLNGAMLISTLIRSPAPEATTCGADHEDRFSRGAEVMRISARPPTMSVYATTRRSRAMSTAGTGYEPGPRNCPPEMLKQYGGKTQTGFWKVPNWYGALHDAPRSRDTATYIAVPLPPWMELSKVR